MHRPELEVQDAWEELLMQLQGEMPDQYIVIECLQALLFGAHVDEYPTIQKEGNSDETS